MVTAVAEGRGHLLLGGEVGVGKARLLQEIMLEARDRDFVALTGHCPLATRYGPYSPVLEALSELAARVPPGIRADNRITKFSPDGTLLASFGLFAEYRLHHESKGWDVAQTIERYLASQTLRRSILLSSALST